jgi:hypothetical protein
MGNCINNPFIYQADSNKWNPGDGLSNVSCTLALWYNMQDQFLVWCVHKKIKQYYDLLKRIKLDYNIRWNINEFLSCEPFRYSFHDVVVN